MKVVVAGDVSFDFNLVRQPRVPAYYHEQVPHAVQSHRPGGAWYVAHLVRLACCDQGSEVQVLTHRQPSLTQDETDFAFSRAYSIWSLHPREEGSKETAWRIEEFLGCEPPSADAKPLPIEGDVADPDLLVLDDMGQGFRDREELWPAALRDGGQPKRIILKTVDSLPAGRLWETLRKEHLDRLTVVMPAAVLRAHAKAMSRAFSWDHTIELTTTEIQEGVAAREVVRCRRVVVQFGGAGAASLARSRLRFGPPSEREREAPDFPVREKVTFERFLFDPEHLEGSWRAKRPGHVVGTTSVLTAALARHELDPASYPLFLALGRGLAAARVNHDVGGGWSRAFEADATDRELRAAYHPDRNLPDPATAYSAAFPRSFVQRDGGTDQEEFKSDLLADLTGSGLEYVAAKATDVVYRGAEKALAAAPKARYGKYLTVDREEIERINAIRSLILSYQANPSDTRPLSIAVFGPPGSGKSFAIKQLAAELFGKQKAVLEFNVAQLAGLSDLHKHFHLVRDAAVRGQVPLVFWDEFDTSQLQWLKDFLAPMQDAEFQAGGAIHPFGKAIFVFAGGTCPNFESFNKSHDKSEPARDAFVKCKGPDFISRLRGFVNIKGPNPITLSDPTATSSGVEESEEEWEELAGKDSAHLIRRAVMLRSVLEHQYSHLIDQSSGLARISPGVVRGLLRVKRYLHGARSLESVVKMSDLAQADRFTVGDLPSPDQLSLHVSSDFLDQVRVGQLEVPVVEGLAKACHDAYRSTLEADGWEYGGELDTANKRSPLLAPYDQLSQEEKEANRLTARLTEAKLREVGFSNEPSGASDRPGVTAEQYSAQAERLAEIEHDIWLRDRLLMGYEWAEQTKKSLRQNRHIAPFATLGAIEQDLDRAIVRSIPQVLAESGYRLVRAESGGGLESHGTGL